MLNKRNKMSEGGLSVEAFVKSVPLIIGFFIFCGSLYLTTYYSCFHINIFNYLETSEILVTFLYLLHEIAFIFALFVGYVVFLKIISWLHEKYSKKKVEDSTKNEANATRGNYISLGITLISLIFCIVYVIKAYLIEIDSNYIIKNRDWMSEFLVAYTFGAAT